MSEWTFCPEKLLPTRQIQHQKNSDLEGHAFGTARVQHQTGVALPVQELSKTEQFGGLLIPLEMIRQDS